MNIGFEAKRLFTNFTGLGNYSRFIVDALSQYQPRHSYYLFTPRKSSHPDVSFIGNRENIHVVAPSGFYRTFKLTSLWRSWGMSRSAVVGALNIFHGLSQELPFGLPAHVKKVVTVHDLIYLRFPQFYNPIDVRIYKTKVTSACRRADVIVAISEQTKQDIVEYLKISPEKIAVIYQGCHPNFKRKVTVQEIASVKQKYTLPEHYILNVGTIEERKNVILLLQALARLPKSDRVPVVIIGKKKSYFDEVQRVIRALDLGEEVIFPEKVSFGDFPAIYQGASVFVYPSLFEGFGIPLIEAIESGIPVITSAGSCFSEAAGPFARYVHPQDAEELAQVIRIVLSDPTLRRNMISESYDYVQRFQPEVISTHIANLYSNL